MLRGETMAIIFFVLAGICLAYYIALISYSGLATPFSEAWLFATIICIIVGICFKVNVIKEFLMNIPSIIKIIFFTGFTAGVLLFIFLLVNVLTGFTDYPEENTECVVVLGAKINGGNVSRALADRLDAAYEYATKEGNEEILIIVSGGQGDDEVVSEAEAMKNYLLAKGISKDRIVMEDKSINTMENLKFSYEIIKEKLGEDAKIAICTSNFHVFRAKLLAKNMGIENVSGIAANTKYILLPNSTVRECLALVKEWMLGNICF